MTSSSSELTNQHLPQVHEKVRFFKDPVSFATHFFGFILATIGMILLLVYSPGPYAKTISFLIYGLSAMALFLASSTYHFFDLGGDKNLILRRIDHSAIFIMIVGTYVPIIMHLLDGWWRIGMFIALGIIGLLGIIFKFTWFHSPRWITVSIYLALGWIILIPGYKLWARIDMHTLIWTLVGGLFYTIGAIIYATKWPNFNNKYFGFHDVWHLFVLGGAGAHFVMVWTLMNTPLPA